MKRQVFYKERSQALVHGGCHRLTEVVLVTLHVVGEGGATQLVRPEEAEVPGHLPGNGGGQAQEEP